MAVARAFCGFATTFASKFCGFAKGSRHFGTFEVCDNRDHKVKDMRQIGPHPRAHVFDDSDVTPKRRGEFDIGGAIERAFGAFDRQPEKHQLQGAQSRVGKLGYLGSKTLRQAWPIERYAVRQDKRRAGIVPEGVPVHAATTRHLLVSHLQ